MNVDIFSLIISKIDPRDTKTFSALRLICKTSWKACVKHSKKLLKEYNEKRFYVYFERLNDWSYLGQFKVSYNKPYSDIFGSFTLTREELQRYRPF